MKEYNTNNDFSIIYTGNDLEYNVNTGIIGLKQYEFKVSNVCPENRESDYSNVDIFYAAGVTSIISDSSIAL